MLMHLTDQKPRAFCYHCAYLEILYTQERPSAHHLSDGAHVCAPAALQLPCLRECAEVWVQQRMAAGSFYV
eukprot:257091-Pleurochrysis_carterae.AAC.2